MSKKWSKEEIEILKKSNGEVPSIEERSRDAVREKMIELGLIKTKKKYHWTAEELKLLADGETNIPGRSADSIKHARNRLRVAKSLSFDKNTEIFSWKNKENEVILRDLHDHGFDAQEIFEMKIFNTTQDSIQRKLQRLNLADKKFAKLSDTISDRFKSFLKNNWENKTPRDLMDLWNKENKSHLVDVKQVVYYLAILNIRISYSEIQKINALRKKEKELTTSNKESTSGFSEKIRFERIKIMRDRAENRRDIWTGLSMPKNHELLIKEEDSWTI